MTSRSFAVLLPVLALAGWMANRPQATAIAKDTPDLIPAFEPDPGWPKQLPNNWILGNIAGVHVDDKDQIWVLHRGNTVPLDLGDDYLVKGAGECCQPAPAFIVFDM